MEKWRLLYLLSNKWDYEAIAIWPFVIVKRKFRHQTIPYSLLNHERIHWRQQVELLIIPFYFFYLLEWLWKLLIYRNRHRAYRSISFEQEAYTFERQSTYLDTRPLFAFLKFLGK